MHLNFETSAVWDGCSAFCWKPTLLRVINRYPSSESSSSALFGVDHRQVMWSLKIWGRVQDRMSKGIGCIIWHRGGTRVSMIRSNGPARPWRLTRCWRCHNLWHPSQWKVIILKDTISLCIYDSLHVMSIMSWKTRQKPAHRGYGSR